MWWQWLPAVLGILGWVSVAVLLLCHLSRLKIERDEVVRYLGEELETARAENIRLHSRLEDPLYIERIRNEYMDASQATEYEGHSSLAVEDDEGTIVGHKGAGVI